MPGILKFKNFTASFRKPNLIPFSIFAPGQDLDWIAGASLAGQFTTVSGVIDGQNGVFTLGTAPMSGISLMRNGVEQLEGTMFTVSNITITFTYPYIPQPGDYLSAYIF